MVFGTGKRAEDGSLELTELAKHRAYEVAKTYYNHSFKRGAARAILIAGGYSKLEFPEEPPAEREAHLIKDFLKEEFFIPEEAFAVEDESTNTVENFENSLEAYPDFFDIIGEKRIGLVSQPFHLERAIKVGGGLLKLDETLRTSGKWYRGLPASPAEVKAMHEEVARLAAD